METFPLVSGTVTDPGQSVEIGTGRLVFQVVSLSLPMRSILVIANTSSQNHRNISAE